MRKHNKFFGYHGATLEHPIVKSLETGWRQAHSLGLRITSYGLPRWH